MDTFTPEHKKEVEKLIVDSTIDALEAEIIKEDDLKPIADFVLSKIDLIKNEDELIAFLEELAAKWKFFQPIERFVEGQKQHTEEVKSVDEAQDLIKSGNIDEALQILKAAENGGI